MRFIGNKENLLNKIFDIMQQNHVAGESFFDFFSGTSNVAKFFKKKNYQVFSSDILYFSYCLQWAYIKNNAEPSFDKLFSKFSIKDKALISSPLDKILGFLNDIDPIEGFIYQNYTQGGTINLNQPRLYFSDENGKKIDAIRTKIEDWNAQNLLIQDEYFILIACLVESVSFFSNVSGVYAAFQKKWDPRALKPFIIRPINLIFNQKENGIFNKNSLDLLDKIDVDILYLDPPYNERQYAPNYHLLETIAKYDAPKIKGITGMRDYTDQKSSFCNKLTALRDLERIVKEARYKYLILSYNSEGILEHNEIMNVLETRGKVIFTEFDYLRFKSNNKAEDKTKKHIKEQLYILRG